MNSMAGTILLCAAAILGAQSCRALAEEPGMQATVGIDGTLHVQSGGREVCVFHAGLFEKGWKMAQATGVSAAAPGQPGKFSIKAGGTRVRGEAAFAEKDGALHAAYTFNFDADVALSSLHVSADFSETALAGGKWTAGEESGEFPRTFKDVHLKNLAATTLKISLPAGRDAGPTTAGGGLELKLDEATAVLLQDNRQWNPGFSVRIGPQDDGGRQFKRGESLKIAFTLSTPGGLKTNFDAPTTIVAGPEWIPLKLNLDIEPGSALDFSGMGLQDAPAGKHGRVIARPDGQFAFEKNPEIPRRFYGVNFCFSAHFITHEQSDRLAERLVRLGYNAVRVHHYEGELIRGAGSSTALNPEKADQLDYLLAACAKRGLYITTDLFVSRPVPYKEIGIERTGNVEMDTFKVMIPVHAGAYENWKAFAKALLTHVNPHTKLRYADDPALAWIAMINEGNFGNFLDRMKNIPEWKTAWNKWLAAKYPERQALAEAWKTELKEKEDPAAGSVEMAANIYGSGHRVADFALFLSATEREMILKMKAFLRDEIGCKALISNMSSWTNHVSDQAARAEYDYVDDHFYVDHPNFLANSWQLPSRCNNSSPVAGGASGGRQTAFTRLFDKPFTITEYNYSGPGRYRGVGGILTGALGALQGWGGIWRFAYSHSNKSMFEPSRLDYFNMATDPLGQASERASLCLYLRGDMKAAPHWLCVVTNTKQATSAHPMPKLAPPWHWAAWTTRIGTRIDNAAELTQLAILKAGPVAVPAGKGRVPLVGDKVVDGVNPYATDSAKMFAVLKSEGILGEDNPTDPGKSVYRSETGEITIDAPRNTMILDTAKTAGGFAPDGQTIETRGGVVAIAMKDSDATVWVSALDGQPIGASQRLLVTHLTDLQNTDIKYAEKARQTLLDWGKLPHLVRAGKADVRIKHQDAAKLKVWALDTAGKRIGEVKAAAAGGVLAFTADVAEGAAEGGARMLYEIAP